MSPDLPCCHKCGARSLVATWTKFTNGTVHIRGDCTGCGKFSHYLPQTPAAVRAADVNGEFKGHRTPTEGGLFDECSE